LSSQSPVLSGRACVRTHALHTRTYPCTRSHARDFIHRRLRITVPPTGSSSCRALHSCTRRATKAKAELSVMPVSRHIWLTAPIGRAPWRATAELAAVAKPPVCPRTHARKGRPRPDTCCGIRVALVEPHRPSWPRWHGTPPQRCCVFPVFRRVGPDLVSRPDMHTRTRPNHRWASSFPTLIFCSQDNIPAA
jgi:hypothetical protein